MAHLPQQDALSNGSSWAKSGAPGAVTARCLPKPVRARGKGEAQRPTENYGILVELPGRCAHVHSAHLNSPATNAASGGGQGEADDGSMERKQLIKRSVAKDDRITLKHVIKSLLQFQLAFPEVRLAMLSRAHQSDHPQALITRTPGRSILKGRAGLQENTPHVTGKGNTHRIPPHTPFQKPLKGAILEVNSLKKPHPLSVATTTRPLLDKTPFPNRVAPPPLTPAPQVKPQPGDTPNSLLRPSSTRSRIRAPRSASTIAAQNTESATPVNHGTFIQPFEDGDSSVELTSEVTALPESTPQTESLDEIEYMAPTAIFPDYEPPFEMPSYTTLGKSLMNLAQSYPYEDLTSPDYEYIQDAADGLGASWPRFKLAAVTVPAMTKTRTTRNAVTTTRTPAPIPSATSNSRPPTRLTYISMHSRSQAPTPRAMQGGARAIIDSTSEKGQTRTAPAARPATVTTATPRTASKTKSTVSGARFVTSRSTPPARTTAPSTHGGTTSRMRTGESRTTVTARAMRGNSIPVTRGVVAKSQVTVRAGAVRGGASKDVGVTLRNVPNAAAPGALRKPGLKKVDADEGEDLLKFDAFGHIQVEDFLFDV